MRGRRPIPTHLKLVTGNPGKRRLNEAEPALVTGVPSPPPALSEIARKEWRRVAKRLHAIGILTTIDRGALAAYCQAYGRWQQAEIALAAEGDLVISTRDGNLIQNPLVGIANKSMADMVRYAVEFGMTPSSRSRIKAAGTDNQKTDPAEKYFG